MKKLLIVAAFMTMAQSAGAWISTAPAQKEYNFKFQLKGQTLELKKSAVSYEDAFEAAAQQCFKFFKGEGRISEERGLDIIDVCANPRS